MNLAAFDLNLLRVFQALMSERHVTRAGQRIGLSQPAMSAALNRLRAIFDDELFIRTAGNMVPTPRALELAEPVGEALRRIEQAISAGKEFEPAREERDFAILGIDYVSYLLAPPLFAKLQNTAPGIVVRFVDARSGPIPHLLEEGRIDLAVEVMHELPDPVRSQFLLQERYVVIMAGDHPDTGANGAPGSVFDLDLYCRLPHVLHSLAGGATGNVDAALAAINRKRHVALSLPHFFSIARAVATSRMIATYPARLATSVAPLFGLRVYEPPVNLAPISLAMIWHRRNDGEPGHVWLRQEIMAAARGLD